MVVFCGAVVNIYTHTHTHTHTQFHQYIYRILSIKTITIPISSHILYYKLLPIWISSSLGNLDNVLKPPNCLTALLLFKSSNYFTPPLHYWPQMLPSKLHKLQTALKLESRILSSRLWGFTGRYFSMILVTVFFYLFFLLSVPCLCVLESICWLFSCSLALSRRRELDLKRHRRIKSNKT